MISFPNCKINLGLSITSKRNDGYHELETVFVPVGLKDVLEIIPSPERLELRDSGLSIPGERENNLCFKAFRLLQKDFPEVTDIYLHLHKHIPMGAGLGGGSADGSFTLVMLNQLFSLGLNEQQLESYALQLGSDCPFFIRNKPVLAKGRGEEMKTLTLDLSAYTLVLVHPGIHVSTAWAFSQVQPHVKTPSIEEVIQLPMDQWKHQLINDFEAPVIARYPEIGDIRDGLYEQGALYSAMSGSGSTVFGIFPENAPFKIPSDWENYRTDILPKGLSI